MLLPSRGSKAFTLLELIVVIVILGILAAIAIPTFQKVVVRSQDESAAETLRAVDREARALAAFENRAVTEEDYAAAASDLPVAALGVHAASYTTGNVATPSQVGVRIDGAAVGLSSVSESGNCVLLTGSTAPSSPASTLFVRPELGANCSGTTALSGPEAPSPGFSEGLASAPQGASAVAGVASAKVSWSAPVADGGSPVTGYVVKASPGTASLSVGADVFEVTFEGLTAGAAYTFEVVAVNAMGSSAPATAGPVTVADVPSAPQNVSFTVSGTSANVFWAAPASDGGSPVTGYVLTSTPATPQQSLGADARSAAVSGLSYDTSYTFHVTAVNVVGSSPKGSSPSGSTASAPSAPQSVSATAGVRSATVSWAAPLSDGGATISSYVVTSTPATVEQAVSGSTLSTSMTGLADGTSYTFHVKAVNVAGSSPSASSNAVTTPSAPDSPTSVTATGVSGSPSVSVSFTPGASNGSTITGYTVTSSPGGVTASGSSSPITVSGLTSGTSYTFTVVAKNGVGSSAPSAPSNAVTAGGTVSFSYTGVNQSWTVPAGVSSVTLSALGGSGGNGNGGRGGYGLRVESRLGVAGGQVLSFSVGGRGQDQQSGSIGGTNTQAQGGWPDGGKGGLHGGNVNGAGGGGSTKVWNSSTGATFVVAGAGGGAGSHSWNGGESGSGGDGSWTSGLIGERGKNLVNGDMGYVGYPGAGATQSGAGAGGPAAPYSSGTYGFAGSGSVGGRGGDNGGSYGGSGGGGGGGFFGGGGGAGGYYYGGGSGGGAGSSFVGNGASFLSSGSAGSTGPGTLTIRY